MNILFFLKPKSEIVYLFSNCTLRQALENMEQYKYSAIPIIDFEGEYVGTITEGDLLWIIKNKCGLNLEEAEEIPITQIPRRMDNTPVNANARIEDLISKSMNQNFVPVIDDEDKFIGIITRKDIIEFCYNQFKKYL